MELQGSNNAVLDQDVQTQLLSLFAKVDERNAARPNAFAGDFKQALQATQRQAQDIIAKIAAGQQPTAAELKKFKTVRAAFRCKAVEVGTNSWKSDIETQFPLPRGEQIQTVLDSLEIYKNQLIAVMNCAGAATTTTGGNDFKEFYTHFIDCPTPILFQPIRVVSRIPIVENRQKEKVKIFKIIHQNYLQMLLYLTNSTQRM